MINQSKIPKDTNHSSNFRNATVPVASSIDPETGAIQTNNVISKRKWKKKVYPHCGTPRTVEANNLPGAIKQV